MARVRSSELRAAGLCAIGLVLASLGEVPFRPLPMRYLLLLSCLLLSTLLADSAAPGPTPPLAAQWKRIDALLAKNQTATATPLVEKIYRQAKAEGNAPAYVRALLYKMRLLENKENDADEKAIALLEADVKTATFPARPILHSLLAGLYAAYFNQHRYQLYQRTAGAAPTEEEATPGAADGGTSLATWDARRLGRTIARHYAQSVQDEPQRQLQTSLAALGDLATGGDAEGRALRPTLYDLLAQRAIAGLQNQELTVAQPEQRFTLAAYPAAALFGPARDFAALKLQAPATDSLNHELLTLHLLQQLTGQRLSQPQNPAALADVDLQRLDYLRELTKNADQAAAYEPALAREAEANKALPISTEFVARRAEARHAAGDDVAAVRLARLAETQFPKSRGAARARQLRQHVERPEVSISAADIVVPGQLWRLSLTARNVAGLHAWAYRISLAEWANFNANRGDDLPLPKHFARALRAAPAAAWPLVVPPHPLDYREQKWAAAGPALPAGYYLLVVSSKATAPTAPQAGDVTAYAALGASELSAVNRRQRATGAPQLLVMQRRTGQPLAGILARTSYSKGPLPTTAVRTDASGIATLPLLPEPKRGQERQQLQSVHFSQGTDTLLVQGEEYYGSGNQDDQDKPETRTFLFTDRAIYRPGQTLYFKGIVLTRTGAATRLLTGQAQTVRLLDPNGQTVQTLPFTTSDFGSFNGSVVLPAGLLNGEFQLETDHGSLSVSVEDYKRPTFLVQLDSVPGRPQLGQPLAVQGRARAYAGPATDGAQVQYRVTRRALFALFDYGLRGGRIGYPGGREVTEIAHGTTTTDADGRFTVTFTPPLAPVQPGRGGWQPGFVFEVTADVTSAAGETRSANRGYVIGHNPLSLRLAGPDAVDKRRLPVLSLFSTNATGEGLPATGTLRLLARRYRPSPPGVSGPAPKDADNEAPAELVKTRPFDTKAGAALDVAALLADVPTGRYCLEALVAGADSAHAQLDFTLYDSQARTIPFATPDWFVALADSVAPGQPAAILLGSSEADAHILLEVECGGQLLRQEWLTLAAGEQRRVEVASGPATAQGPLYIHTTQVRDNQLYQHTASLKVAAPAQSLQLSISTFRDHLQPGQRETWRVTIHQADGKPAEAELLATLYDQSLDLFRSHSFQGLEMDEGYYPAVFEWQGDFGRASWIATTFREAANVPDITYPVLNTWDMLAGPGAPGSGPRIMLRGISSMAANAPAPMASRVAELEVAGYNTQLKEAVVTGSSFPNQQLQGKASGLSITGAVAISTPDLSAVPTRTDFRETAFWEPALRTDAHGEVVLEFQMPEAVTRWQLLALAHDRQLRTGQLARQLVTQKDIQLTPNAPRFLRPGDSFTFPATLANLTDAPVAGTAQLYLLDAATGQDITGQLLPGTAQQPVRAGAHQSQAVGWPLVVPVDFAPVAVTYKVVASVNTDLGPTPPHVKYRIEPNKDGKLISKKLTDKERQKHFVLTFTDGEQNTLPVLPNRVLITESLPLPIVGLGTREFELKKLTSTSSATRRNQSLTLEMTANPAWYAVQSLPYLLEYPYECSEQVFDRLYANLLAASILKSNPRLKPILAEWTRQAQSGTPAQREALASQLAQNQDLKNLLLQETPWVQDARSETERLARLSSFFDEARLQSETTRALAKLRAMQQPSGAFPWFAQMPADRYLSQLIVEGFGKLKALHAFDARADDTAGPLLTAALGYLDQQLTRDYAGLRKQKNVHLAADHLDDLQIQALYARSYWPQQAVPAATRPALAYYQSQAARYWPTRTRYLQAQAALALHRADGKSAASALIMRALTENALHSPELGMYWKDVQPGYYWREAPTETQATLIEAFWEVKNDQKSVDELKLWLLKQKQTQHWESTRATADACYALLLRGSDWLAPSQPLQLTVGGEKIEPASAQAGTGYFARTWPGAAVQPAQGRVSITKPTAGVAWGALYWQYFEDIDKVTPAASPLSLERQLYRETTTATGPALENLTAASPLHVGDVLVVRLVLRTDRALEYVHLKDQRAAGLELLSQLSGYQYQAGLGYYESPRDAATHFFFSAVPRGTHVLEYRLRASQRGDFSGGLSQVQCLYAPEFGATSAGTRLVIGAK